MNRESFYIELKPTLDKENVWTGELEVNIITDKANPMEKQSMLHLSHLTNLIACCVAYIDEHSEFLEVIVTAKLKGVRLAILSNELDLFYGSEFREKLSFLEDFEVIHDATYTKILKPTPDAYISCLRDLNLRARDCLFIDDQKRNIDGAKNIGLSTIHFNVIEPRASYKEVVDRL